MAVTSFPITQPPISGWKFTQVENAVRNKTDDGYVISRKKFTKTVAKFTDVTWNLSDSDFLILESFYTDTSEYGSLSFFLEIPLESGRRLAYTVFFSEPPAMTYLGAGCWEVKCSFIEDTDVENLVHTNKYIYSPRARTIFNALNPLVDYVSKLVPSAIEVSVKAVDVNVVYTICTVSPSVTTVASQIKTPVVTTTVTPVTEDKYDGITFPTFGTPTHYLSSYSPAGDGVTNDTTVFETALKAASAVSGTLYVNKTTNGYFVDNIDFPGNVKVIFEAGTVLKASSTFSWVSSSGVFKIVGVSNIGIKGNGLIIQMPTEPSSWFDSAGKLAKEYPQSIRISTCSNIYMEGVTVSNAWSDGIYVYNSSHVYINNCVVDKFNRNGFTVISGTDVIMVDCLAQHFYNHSDTIRGQGFGLEPNHATDPLSGVHLRYCKSVDVRNGFAVSLHSWLTEGATSSTLDVSFDHCTSIDVSRQGIRCGTFYNAGTVSGTGLRILSPYDDGATVCPIYIENSSTASPHIYVEIDPPSYVNPSTTQSSWASAYASSNQKYVMVENIVSSSKLEIVTI